MAQHHSHDGPWPKTSSDQVTWMEGEIRSCGGPLGIFSWMPALGIFCSNPCLNKRIFLHNILYACYISCFLDFRYTTGDSKFTINVMFKLDDVFFFWGCLEKCSSQTHVFFCQKLHPCLRSTASHGSRV